MGIIELIREADYVLVAVTSILILFLGFSAYLNNKKSLTNKTFLAFSVLAVSYAVANYLFYTLNSEFLVTLASRLVIFFVIWYSFLLYQLFYVFPYESMRLSRMYKYVLVPIVALVSLISLTPLVFSSVSISQNDSQIPVPQVGWGAIFFVGITMYLTIGSMVLLFKKLLKSAGFERKRILLVFIGTIITYSLYLVFNLFFTVVLGDTRFIPLAPLFFLPFIVLTFYAIVRYHLLSIRLIATEILILGLSLVTLFEVFVVEGWQAKTFRSLIFILVGTLGTLLIRSVRREVEQRERIEAMADDLKKANVQLEALMRVKTEFMQIASHQLRTPVSVIKGTIDMLRGGDLDNFPPEKRKEYLDRAYMKSEKLNEIITDILSATEMDTPEFDLDETLKPVNLKEMARDGVESHQSLAQQHGLTLDFVDVGDVPSVMASEQFLPQVITNYISNAIQYTPKGGIIKVKVFEDKGKVACAVSDTGIGVSAEDLKKLWHKFVRADNANNMHTDGSGLGLFVVKKIVEGHKGGEVFVESELEKGSTFGFRLPAVDGSN